jgi:hypothetical protein
VSSPSCAGPKSICPSMTSLSHDANFAMAPRAPSAALAGFEAKPDETVAAGFEAETSKPRCRRVSPRPAILTAGKSLPVPLHSGHLVTCTGFPLALTWSSRRLHQPDGFKAKPSETSVSLAFSTCQHGSPLTSPGLPIVRPPSPKLVPDPRR